MGFGGGGFGGGLGEKEPDLAPPDVTEAPDQSAKTNQEADQEVEDRTGPQQGDGLGRIRLFTEDLGNSVTRIAVAASVSRQATVAAAEAVSSTNIITSTPVSGATTPEQRVLNLQTQTVASRKGQTDVTRAKQNLQRKCNHSFSFATKRCIYCNKARSSHVFDQ